MGATCAPSTAPGGLPTGNPKMRINKWSPTSKLEGAVSEFDLNAFRAKVLRDAISD